MADQCPWIARILDSQSRLHGNPEGRSQCGRSLVGGFGQHGRHSKGGQRKMSSKTDNLSITYTVNCNGIGQS